MTLQILKRWRSGSFGLGLHSFNQLKRLCCCLGRSMASPSWLNQVMSQVSSRARYVRFMHIVCAQPGQPCQLVTVSRSFEAELQRVVEVISPGPLGVSAMCFRALTTTGAALSSMYCYRRVLKPATPSDDCEQPVLSKTPLSVGKP